MFFGETKRLGKQPDMRFSGTNHRHRPYLIADDDFDSGTDPRQHVSKVAGGFRFRDVDDVLGHERHYIATHLLPFNIERGQQFGAVLGVAFFRCRTFGLLLGGTRVLVHQLELPDGDVRVDFARRGGFSCRGLLRGIRSGFTLDFVTENVTHLP
jgi:hypothetical protein